MENILNILILIILCVGLTIFFIKESDNIKGQSKNDVNEVLQPWGKIMFWSFIIIFGIYLLLYGTKYG
tara:strand:+ start:742 stop:945 length:204 start_codon:yes stop_codon:yes gene_type:complete